MKPLLEALDVHFAYGRAGGRPGGHAVLQGIDLQVMPGEVIALLGANGGGKSTLLRLLLGLLQPARGEVWLGGRRYRRWSRPEIARRVAYVPQSQLVPFPYRVRDLVALGCIARRGLYRRLNHDDDNTVSAALERLQIESLAERNFAELSGGQQQLCLIARALAQRAPLIVLDEPITGLDYGNQWRLLGLIGELSREGYTFIKSTHYPEHALSIASRVLLLQQGRILAQGTPQQVITPDTLRRLYGLEVALHPLADGRTALLPDL